MKLASMGIARNLLIFVVFCQKSQCQIEVKLSNRVLAFCRSIFSVIYVIVLCTLQMLRGHMKEYFLLHSIEKTVGVRSNEPY